MWLGLCICWYSSRNTLYGGEGKEAPFPPSEANIPAFYLPYHKLSTYIPCKQLMAFAFHALLSALVKDIREQKGMMNV